MFIKRASDMIDFRNPYLVKSENVAFTHVLLWYVYHGAASSNEMVDRPELFASFLTPDETNLVQVISCRTGLIPCGEKTHAAVD